jgi:hypothetical protein
MQTNASGVNCATDSTPAGDAAAQVLPPEAYPLYRAPGCTGIVVSRGMVCGLVGCVAGIAIGVWLANTIRGGRN